VSLLRRKTDDTYIIDKRKFRSRLRKLLGTRPGNLPVYAIAFIHRSASYILPDGKKVNNERLEFLGDAVLDAILSDYLFEKFPDGSEGFMTKIRSRIVNRELLNHLALEMEFDKTLISNIRPVSSTVNPYGDALEAFIGALFLDKGFKKAKKIFIRRVLNRFLDLDQIINTDSDYKSLVFEWVQKHKSSMTFTYKEENDSGIKKPVFTTTVIIDGEEYGTGQGGSKKEAEQRASEIAWGRLKELAGNNNGSLIFS